MEPSVQVALVGLLGVLITSIIGAFVALSTSRKEKRSVAETTIEKTLRERITLRDEQRAELEDDNGKLIAENAALLSKNQVLHEENEKLREDNRKLKRLLIRKEKEEGVGP